MMNRIAAFALPLVLLLRNGQESFAKPSNDRCIDAVTLVAGEKVNGDNSNANFDYNNQGVCGARSDRRAVWYEINGNGKEVTVNVCTNNDKLTDFGIFNACNTQNCLGFPPQQKAVSDCAADETNQYAFLAEDGESYYVHVRSDVLFEGEGSNFTIWYTEPTDAPTETPVAGEEMEESGSEASSGRAKNYYRTILLTAVAGIGFAVNAFFM